MVPYSVELLESLDDTIENYINGGNAVFNGEAIEEEDEEDEVVVASGEKNRLDILLRQLLTFVCNSAVHFTTVQLILVSTIFSKVHWQDN